MRFIDLVLSATVLFFIGSVFKEVFWDQKDTAKDNECSFVIDTSDSNLLITRVSENNDLNLSESKSESSMVFAGCIPILVVELVATK
ncbi:MAG: hypothetical protein JXO44_14945 [Clostridia bacterium]|nr:hypothetical protein [Clostridia bacterium]